MATSLVVHERVRTTLPKAKELRRVAERVVTWAKQPHAAQYRIKAAGFLRSTDAVNKLFKELGPRYACVWLRSPLPRVCARLPMLAAVGGCVTRSVEGAALDRALRHTSKKNSYRARRPRHTLHMLQPPL
jgi:hypothetical protein